uniref:Uncharacterized protein n=1 Tax=viral metagenome TaxID=1070528 RepID=A0A6M3KQV5_9ZZZZ
MITHEEKAAIEIMIMERFQEVKEDRLERLIRGGLLRRPDAREALSGFAETVKRTLGMYRKID